MKKWTMITIGIQVVIMVMALVPPLLLKQTGQVVYLETQKMGPRALIRGDYVVLGYKVGDGIIPRDQAQTAVELGWPVYVTVTTDRPGKFVAWSYERPDLQPGQACIVGRVRSVWWSPNGTEGTSVDFPQIAQFFVSEGQGHILEQQRGDDLLAEASVSSRCNAVLLGLEMR